MHNVYEYVIDNQGIDVESSYPYKGRVRETSNSAQKINLKWMVMENLMSLYLTTLTLSTWTLSK